MSDFCSPVEVIPPVGHSDHKSVLQVCTLQKAHVRNQYIKVDARRGKASAKQAFGEWLTRVNWTSIYIVLNRANKNMFQNVIETGLDYFFPKRTVKLHDKDKPWVTLGYKNLIAKRQRAFIRGDHSLYCRLRNQVVHESKRLRSTFLNTKLAELKTNKNNRKWWNTCSKTISGLP